VLRAWDDQLVGLRAARAPAQRHERPAVAADRADVHGRVAGGRGADEFVERHAVGSRQRQQRLQVRPPLERLGWRGTLDCVGTGGRPGGAVFVAADVHYLPLGGARAAAVVAADAAFSCPAGDRVAVVPDVAPYQPGQFYLRELPPLRAVLDGLPGLRLLLVDGYADLDPDGRPGLGARAREEFGVPVIGVAKTFFRTATHAIPILRGTSARPLYVTAAGMPREAAADLIRHMAGRHRLPDALRRADTLARHGLPGPPSARLRLVLVAIGLVAEGEDRRLDAVLQAEFGEDAPDVGLDGLLADRQVPGDLPVAVTAGDQPEHVAFAR
jgi:deoxyribonuclease V